MKRLLSLFFIALFIASIFTGVVHAAGDTQRYHIQVYDSQGRAMQGDVVSEHMKIILYHARTVLGIPVGWTKYVEFAGGACNFTGTSGEKIRISVMWFKKQIYDNVQYLSTESNISVQLTNTPAVPIMNIRSEGLSMSADIHEISSAYYDVKYGIGSNKNEIKIQLGDKSFFIPVTLHMSDGSNSDTKDFRFLAQAPNTTVTGTDKFLIWETGRWLSGVHTAKVGDNAYMVVWTYIYADTWGAWKDKIVTQIMAGALIGAMAGAGTGIGLPAGAAGGAAMAAVMSGIEYALWPTLANLSAHTAVGVVAGYFTPRWFIVQGTSGLGSNGTKGTVSMDTSSMANGMLLSGNRRYDIYTQSNTIQVGYTKFYGTGMKSKSYDFEDGAIPPFVPKAGNGNTVDASIETSKVYAGQGAMQVYNSGSSTDAWINISKIFNLTAGDYSVTVDMEEYPTESLGTPVAIGYGTETSQTTINSVSSLNVNQWNHVLLSGNAQLKSGQYIYLQLAIDSSSYKIYLDNLNIQITNNKDTRLILETGSGDASIARHIFGTIPQISPLWAKPTQITRKYTLLSVDVSQQKGGFLALDWKSPQVDMYYSRIFIRTQTHQETAWLLGTDNLNGFKNVTFVITNPKQFIYHIDLYQYYALSTPQNWTIQPDWTPWIANNTMIYTIPPSWNGPGWFDAGKYNLQAWWNNLPLAWKAFVMALPLLILFLILLIIAPWVIVALIKGIAMVIRALGKGFGAVGKAFAGRKRGR